MKIYIHKNCSSCKKALKWLEANQIEAEIINLLEQSPSPEELQQMAEAYEGNLKKLFNTSGQLYRELGLKDQVATMSAKDVYDLLGKEGMLVKRPFLLTGNRGLVGFKEAEWETLKS